MFVHVARLIYREFKLDIVVIGAVTFSVRLILQYWSGSGCLMRPWAAVLTAFKILAVDLVDSEVVGHDMFLSTLPLRLVSLAALAQARTTLLSPTVHPIHLLLRWLYSLASMRQFYRSLVAGSVVSIRSTLDDGTQAPSSGPQGAPKREPSETKHTETRTRTHAHIERHGETRHRGAC